MSDYERSVELEGRRDGDAVPATLATVEGSGEAECQVSSRHCGMRYAPENRHVVERARTLLDKQWEKLPIEYLPSGTPLEANVETLSRKIIDKVVTGAEPLRQGYFIRLLRTDDGQLHIVDGHHRVAMYHALGEEMPVQIMDSSRIDSFA